MNNFDYKFKKYGKGARSNVKWEYNLDPLKKITIIILITILGTASFLLYKEKKENNERLRYTISKNKVENDRRSSSEAENEIKALQGILKSIKEQQSQPSQDIYVWNENGKTRASNTNRPAGTNNVKKIESVATPSTETKFVKQGKSILLPVIIGHNGKAIQVNMVLDTGCSITLLDAEVSNALSLQQTGIIETIVADGRKLSGGTGKIDFFQVGPFKESGFLVNTRPIMGNNKTQHGLLGMNFLEKHPFTIDHQRQVIRWM